MQKNFTSFLIAFAAFFLFSGNAVALFSDSPQKGQFDEKVEKIQLTLNVENYTETLSDETLNAWVTQKTALELSPTSLAEIENTSYCPTSNVFCELTLSSSDRQKIKLRTETIYNAEAVQKYVEDLARKVNRDPVDAKFSIEEGKVSTFSEAQHGLVLDETKSVEAILEAFKNSASQTIQLPFESKKPEVNYGDVNNLGISALIGEGTSDFKGSPKNRVHNIKVATQRYNGILIKPGEEFSFVSLLGEVDGAHGYLPELVIKNNATEPEFGGGICQVSSTAFRAAIYSGLKITARKNHAYPVSYYSPQGMDATVYVPRPDLRFLNNTPNHILIQTKIVGTQLTFSFYGTDDGRKVVVDGPNITERKPDGALKASFTQHVFDKNGQEVINDIFNSSYNSPYKYPHPGGPVLSTKPSNWTEEEWKAYKKTIRDMERIAKEAKI